MSGGTEGPDLDEQLSGYLLITGGILIALLSGACSLGVLTTIVSLASKGDAGSLATSLMVVGVFGGLPFLAGCAMVAGGRALLRRRKRPDTGAF